MSQEIKLKPTLREAYEIVLGGVMAMSPKRYENSLAAIARIVGREVDSEFRIDIAVIQSSLPCVSNMD